MHFLLSTDACAKRPRKHPLFFAVILAATIVAAQALDARAQFYAKPITTPDLPYQMDGYSISPPRGSGWFEMQRDRDFVYFGKRLNSPTHSFIAVAMSSPVGDAFDSVEKFRDHVIRKIAENPDDHRNRVLLAEAEIEPMAGPFCARYHTKTEDRDATDVPGLILFAETFGVSCLHPERRDLAIDISYSERGLPAETGASLLNEGENFVRSLKFISQP